VRTRLWGAMTDGDRQPMYDPAAQQLPLGRFRNVGDVTRAYPYCMEREFGIASCSPWTAERPSSENY